MNHHLKLGTETLTVTASKAEDNTVSITIGENVYHVAAHRMDGHHLHLRVNGKGRNVVVLQNGSGKTVIINGQSYTVEDMDLLNLSAPRKRSMASPGAVTPPMPSVVSAVLVNIDDPVVKGQGLVVVSAMKMETTLSAPYDGVVREIKAKPGDKVNPGDVLVDIERKSEQ